MVHGPEGQLIWNNHRGIAEYQHGHRDQCWPMAIMALRAGDKGSTVTWMSDTSELAPSWAGGEPAPKAQRWEQLEGASLNHGTDERGRSQFMGVPEDVESCFSQNLSLACSAKLGSALQHHVIWHAFSSHLH